MQSPRVLLAVTLLAVALCASLVRELNNQRITRAPAGDPGQGWFSGDADTLYHARRLARALDEHGSIAATDAALNFPEGAAIPWPPYYTRVLQGTVGLLAPRLDATRAASSGAPRNPAGADERARRDAFLERACATLPFVFGVLTALACAWCAWDLTRSADRRAGLFAAALAGAAVACAGASVHNSVPGNGDHHAFAALLMVALFGILSRGLGPGVLPSRRACALHGALAGGAAGVLLGSWVGGLVWVLVAQLALGWAVLRSTRVALPGLGPLGAGFHVAAAAALTPAVLASPWKDEHPWMVVNLSWFHLAQLVLGACVFVPLCLRARTSLTPRAWPLAVALVLGLLGAAVAWSDLPFARGVREGFAWAGRSNEFMAYVAESQPLLWGQAGSLAECTRQLGLLPWLLVPAWWWAARRAFAAGELAWSVWAIAVGPLALQALMQQRFADALCPPMAIVCAGAVSAGLARARRALPRPALAWALTGLLGGIAVEYPPVAMAARRTAAGLHWARGPEATVQRGRRELAEWLRAQRGQVPAGGAVLAAWYHGHQLEWAADSPTVATNFGSYVGVDGYLAPWRFFLESDERAAESILQARHARYVLAGGDLTNDLEVMLRLCMPDRRAEFRSATPQGTRLSPAWYATLGARLLFEGRAVDVNARTAGDSLDFVRLVHVSGSPFALPLAIPYLPAEAGEPPCGWVWERVEGARLVARGAVGESLRASVEIAYPGRARPLRWSRSAVVGADGGVELRVPYATRSDNGDGRATGPLRWSLGARAGELDLDDDAVRAGARIELD